MPNDLDLWQFVSSRLQAGEDAMLLVVAESSGSSPGRAGYKMGVAADGELCGSIGGGVMEVSLVEQAKADLAEAVEMISDGADAASDGNLPALIATIAMAVPKIADAITRYTKVVAELKEKAENYKKAVEKNIEVIKSF